LHDIYKEDDDILVFDSNNDW